MSERGGDPAHACRCVFQIGTQGAAQADVNAVRDEHSQRGQSAQGVDEHGGVCVDRGSRRPGGWWSVQLVHRRSVRSGLEGRTEAIKRPHGAEHDGGDAEVIERLQERDGACARGPFLFVARITGHVIDLAQAEFDDLLGRPPERESADREIRIIGIKSSLVAPILAKHGKAVVTGDDFSIGLQQREDDAALRCPAPDEFQLQALHGGIEEGAVLPLEPRSMQPPQLFEGLLVWHVVPSSEGAACVFVHELVPFGAVADPRLAFPRLHLLIP